MRRVPTRETDRLNCTDTERYTNKWITNERDKKYELREKDGNEEIDRGG